MKWAVISLALLTLASCQNKDQSMDPTLTGFFPEDTGEVRKPNQFAEVMAASGARSDATLSKHHFDGGRLNSLGEEKLSYMLKDDRAASPMSVYLNLDEKAAASNDRKTAVVEFLKDKGLTAEQIEVVYGYNPASWSPSAEPLSKKDKATTATKDGGSPSDSEASAGGKGGAGGGTGGAGGGGGGTASGGGGGLFGSN
jgi:uncharacterized membrane protein YgcG